MISNLVGNTNDVELLPNEVMQIPDTEVALPDHHLRTLQTPVDPIAFHKILQKHINNQIIKTIKSGTSSSSFALKID